MEENFIEKGEKILITSKYSGKACTMSKLKSCLLYIIMWVLMNAFFIYLLLLEKLAYKYWFVAVPIICFDIVGILVLYNLIAKSINKIADCTYAITDKAFYLYNKGKYKQIKRFAFEDIILFEKDKTNAHIFYVCTKNDFIEVSFIENENEFYAQIAKMVNSK